MGDSSLGLLLSLLSAGLLLSVIASVVMAVLVWRKGQRTLRVLVGSGLILFAVVVAFAPWTIVALSVPAAILLAALGLLLILAAPGSAKGSRERGDRSGEV